MTKPNQTTMTDEQVRAARAHCRKSVALYLIDLAKLIEHGAVDGFEIGWNHTVLKLTPNGSILFDAEYLSTTKPEPESVVVVPRPAPETTVAQDLASERSPISVEDLSEEISDLKPCADPECTNCKKD
jgi:hypothetical protein